MQIPDFLSNSVDKDSELEMVAENIIGVTKNIAELEHGLRAKKNRIILISGLSGAGKDSVLDRIHDKFPQSKRVKTYTTRERRAEESVIDDPYNRVSPDEVKEEMRSNDALKCVRYAGNYYCTSFDDIDDIIMAGQTPLLRVDPVGAGVFLDKWRSGEGFFAEVSLYYFFIVPESYDDLRQRLVHRGEDGDTVEKRIEQSQKDAAYIKDAQFIVINRRDKLDTVVDEVVAVLNEYSKTG